MKYSNAFEMCQYLCEIQTVGTHDNLIRSGNLTRSVNFCGTSVSKVTSTNILYLQLCTILPTSISISFHSPYFFPLVLSHPCKLIPFFFSLFRNFVPFPTGILSYMSQTSLYSSTCLCFLYFFFIFY